MVKAKDYFDPRIYERMAQISADNALRQGDIRARQSLGNAELFSNLIQQLAQLGTKAYQTKEANEYFSPKEYAAGDIPRGRQQVTTDLLGRQITAPSQFAPDFGQPRPASVTIPQYQGQGTFDPTQDPQRLMQGRMSQNPQLAQMAQTGIENLLMQQPKMFEQSPGSVSTDINRFSPSFGKQTQVPFKPIQDTSISAYEDFRANYPTTPEGRQQAATDWAKAQLGQFETKEQIKAKYRRTPSIKDTKLMSYTGDDGYMYSEWRTPQGDTYTVKSENKVRQPASTEQKGAKLSTLQELTNRIRESSNDEWIGGAISGVSGAGAGGRLGDIREATGRITDEETEFRSNVASLKNQLLYLRSGAQINEQEFKRLEKELPDIYSAPNVFRARLGAFQRQLNDILKSKGKSGSSQRFNILEVK